MPQNYLDSLSAGQKQNASVLVNQMKAKGITNPFTHAAVLAVVSKESAFIPKSENLNYSAQRIQQVWPKIPASVAATLANNPEKLGNYVYGPEFNKQLGNLAGEGFKFRGRGYNQITGRGNYEKIGQQIGVDLINNPDLLNDPKVAADAAILFFSNGINTMTRLGKLKEYNATNINDFKSLNDSLGAIYHVNAGVGSTKAKLDADVTGGRKAALSRVGDLYTFTTGTIAQIASDATEVVKKNPKTTVVQIILLGVGVFLIIKALKSDTK